MARRIINKAYNDLVGGAGTETSVTISPELPKESSVLRLSSKDIIYGNRQAVEAKHVERRQASKAPLQPAHPLQRDSAVAPKSGRTQFVNIDGDGSTKQVDCAQEPKAVPETAYRMRSFMSAVELGLRGTYRPPTQVSSNAGKPPPPPKPDIPKASHPTDDGRMFLPKGIHQTGQPYVLPKFMPSYREMMTPKPRPDPLVSIVEKTPPSLQKWAVEWNSEPKKSISVDELKEDLIREAAETPQKPPVLSQGMSYFHESLPDKLSEDGKPDLSNNNLESHTESNDAKPTEKTHPNTSESRFTPPWHNHHIPTNYESTLGAQERRDTEPNPLKIGRPLVDWVPQKYSSRSRQPNDSRNTEYSFQDAIKKGTPKKAKPDSNGESKLFFYNPAENAVSFDTEEQKFHEWFKARMSAAVQTAVNTPSKAMPKNNHNKIQTTFSACKDSNKPSSVAAPTNLRSQNKLAKGERNPNNSIIQRISPINSNSMFHPELPDRRKPENTVPETPHEAESYSSFYQWLKLRGHHTTKNDQSPPENKTEKDKISQNVQNASQFPWSVSYTLRRRVSTPAVLPKRPASPKNLKKSQKTVSQDGMSRASPKNFKQSPKTASEDHMRRAPSKNIKNTKNAVSQDGLTLKNVKNTNKKSVKSSGSNSIKSSGKKFFKTKSTRSVKSAGKKPSNVAVKRPAKSSTKKISKTESPKVPPSSDHLWMNDSWNVGSEIDHVNHLRKTDNFGNNPKAKKDFHSAGGPQMKYWESKYIKKPGFSQNRNVASVDNAAKPNQYSWLRSKKATDNKSNPKEVITADQSDTGADVSALYSNFSNIAEYPGFPSALPQQGRSKPQHQQDPAVDSSWVPVMGFSEDFDAGRFLHEEEVMEKELLDSTPEKRGNKAKAGGNTENQQLTGKVKGKEHIKFPRLVKVRTESNDVDVSSRQEMQQKLNEDDFVLALGEDPGLEDLEWSEFIGPRNSLDHDSDLTRLIGVHVRPQATVQNSCL